MKKITNKVRTIVAMVVLTATVLTTNAQKVGDKFKEGKLYYKITQLTPNKEVEVTCEGSLGYNTESEKPSGDIVIPETANGYKITAIGRNAFFSCDLTSVKIPESVTVIGAYAFYRNTSLASINIPKNLIKIGDFAFCYADLTSVTIPKSLINIGDGVFGACQLLSTITVAPDNPNYSTKEDVLFDKEQKTLICYPAGKTDTEYTIPNTVTRIKTSAFRTSNLKTVTIIPNTVKYIDEWAFRQSKKLTTLVIPDGVKSIGNRAFSLCFGIKTVTISKTVTTIVGNIFGNCSHMQSITVDANNPKYKSVDGVLFDKEQKTLICYPASKTDTEYTIPNVVTSILAGAFEDAQKLNTIVIPNSIKEFGGWGTLKCINLTTIISKIEDVKNVKMGGKNVFCCVKKDKCKLLVPKGKVDDYKNAAQWSDFENIEEDPNSTAGTNMLIVNNNVSVNGNNITILGVMGKSVKLYSISGQVLYNLHATQENVTLSVNQAGTYILQVENGTRKIVVN